MHIAFRFVGQFEIDDVRDVVDVDAPGGNIGCDKNAGRSRTKPFQRTLTCALRLVTVDRFGAETCRFQMICDAVSDMLGARENQYALECWTLEKVRQQCALLPRRDIEHLLVDVLGSTFRR